MLIERPPPSNVHDGNANDDGKSHHRHQDDHGQCAFAQLRPVQRTLNGGNCSVVHICAVAAAI